jgi:hypothetical protein
MEDEMSVLHLGTKIKGCSQESGSINRINQLILVPIDQCCSRLFWPIFGYFDQFRWKIDEFLGKQCYGYFFYINVCVLFIKNQDNGQGCLTFYLHNRKVYGRYIPYVD